MAKTSRARQVAAIAQLSLAIPLPGWAGYDIRVGAQTIAVRTSDDLPVPEAQVELYVGTFAWRPDLGTQGPWPLFAAESPAGRDGVASIPAFAQRSESDRYHGTELAMRVAGLYLSSSSTLVTGTIPLSSVPGWEQSGDCGAKLGTQSSDPQADALTLPSASLTCHLGVTRARLSELEAAF